MNKGLKAFLIGVLVLFALLGVAFLYIIIARNF